MNRPVILHINHQDRLGGGPVVIAQLMQSLGDCGEQVLVHGGLGALSDMCREKGLRSFQEPIDRIWKCPWGLIRLIIRIRQLKPDLIFVHGQWAGPLGAFAAWCAGVYNLIYVAHWPSYYTSTTLWRSIKNYLAEWPVCRFSRVLVALSEGTRYNFLYRGWAGEKKIRLIHNGVGKGDMEIVPVSTSQNLKKMSTQMRQGSAGAGKDEELNKIRELMQQQGATLNFVCVARLDEQKRIDWLVNAWMQYRKKTVVHSHLWILGEGPSQKKLIKLSNELITDHSITWMGGRPGGVDWVACSDVVVLSSGFEGHALVPLEAMAAARPVVAFKVDGVEDSVVHGQTGLLSEIGKVSEMAEHFLKMENEQYRKQLGCAGQKRWQAYFTEEIMICRYRELISELLPKP